MSAKFFAELKKFSFAFDKDCCALRAAVDRPAKALDELPDSVTLALRDMQVEVGQLSASLCSLEEMVEKGSFESVLGMCERYFAQTQEQLEKAILELEQYGLDVSALPPIAELHSFSAEDSKHDLRGRAEQASMIADDADESDRAAERTFTEERSAAGEEDEGDTHGAQEPVDGLLSQPHSPTTTISTILQEDPPTPSMEDFGITQTTLLVLKGRPDGDHMADHKDAYSHHKMTTLTPAPAAPTAEWDLDADIDLSSLGLKTVVPLQSTPSPLAPPKQKQHAAAPAGAPATVSQHHSGTTLNVTAVTPPDHRQACSQGFADLDDYATPVSAAITSKHAIPPSPSPTAAAPPAARSLVHPLPKATTASMQPVVATAPALTASSLSVSSNISNILANASTTTLTSSMSAPAHPSCGAAGSVGAEEYSKLPEYLRMQVSLDALNTALGSLAAQKAGGAFTEADLKDVVGSGAASKVVLLVLLKTQRIQVKGSQADKTYSLVAM